MNIKTHADYCFTMMERLRQNIIDNQHPVEHHENYCGRETIWVEYKNGAKKTQIAADIVHLRRELKELEKEVMKNA